MQPWRVTGCGWCRRSSRTGFRGGGSTTGPLGPDRVLTAFFFFTSDHGTAANGRRFKRRDHAVVELIAQDVVTLVQIPAGTPVVDRGDAEFITAPGRQAEELRAHPADFLGVRQFTLEPR